MPFLERLFQLLNSNKDFPNYQAERRIDLFINFLLEEILTNYFSDGSTVEYLCPEFPFKKENSNLSTKVDYLCLRRTGDSDEILFVELKTESNSFNHEQLLIYLSGKNWDEYLKELKLIIKKSQQEKKYDKLYRHLENKNISENPAVRIIYISPRVKMKNNTSYEILNEKPLKELIHKGGEHGDEKSIIANYLQEWKLYLFEVRIK